MIEFILLEKKITQQDTKLVNKPYSLYSLCNLLSVRNKWWIQFKGLLFGICR